MVDLVALLLIGSNLFPIIMEMVGGTIQLVSLGKIRYVQIDSNSCPSRMNGLLEFMIKNKSLCVSTSQIVTEQGTVPKGLVLSTRWFMVVHVQSNNLHGRSKDNFTVHVFSSMNVINTIMESHEADVHDKLFSKKTVDTYGALRLFKI